MGDTAEAAIEHTRAFEMYESEGDALNAAIVLGNRAWDYAQLGKFKESLDDQRRRIEVLEGLGEGFHCAAAFLGVAHLELLRGRLDACHGELKSASKHSQSLGCREFHHIILALESLWLRQPCEAVVHAENVISCAKELGKRDRIRANWIRGLAELSAARFADGASRTKSLDGAKEYLEQALDDSVSLRFVELEGLVLLASARRALLAGEIELATSLNGRASHLFDRMNSRTGQTDSLNLAARLRVVGKDPRQAMELAERARALALGNDPEFPYYWGLLESEDIIKGM